MKLTMKGNQSLSPLGWEKGLRDEVERGEVDLLFK